MNRYHNKLNRRTRKQHEGKELNQNATRLKTLLKLPKAHKWVIYEWFYGNLDQSLFKSNQESEFQLCLKEIFPNLKTRSLKRVEWCFIRKLMGKPRRCSPAFFAEERLSLNAKRDKIRQIQHQQKLDNLSNYHDLPKLIPMPLVIGTRVTALQRKPHDGLFNGCVEAVDILNGTYRIAFDRAKISAETVLDHDIRSIAPTEFMPKKAFLCKSRQLNPVNMPVYTPAKLMEMINEQISSPFETTNELNDQFTDNLSKKNSYPIKFLAQLVKLYKILDFKRRRIYELKVMNNEIEKLISNPDEIVSYEIQKQYANTVLDLDKLNKCLNESLRCVKIYTEDLNLSQKEIHNLNKEQTEANKVVALHSQNKNITKNSAHLISNLIKILVHLKEFNKKEINAEEIKNLNESVLDVKDNLYKTNIESFENNVQIHVNFIQTEANHLGSLGILAQSNSEIFA